MTTLYDHLKERSKQRYGGPSTVLTEKEIVASCLVFQEIGLRRGAGLTISEMHGIPGYGKGLKQHRKLGELNISKKSGTGSKT